MIATFSTHPTLGSLAAAFAVMAVGARARPMAPRAQRGSFSEHSIARRRNRPPSVSIGASIIATGLGMLAVGPVAIVIATGTAMLMRKVGPMRRSRRRRDDVERALPEAIDLLVLSVRAGLTPFQAVCELAGSSEPALGDAFGEVVRRTERGLPFADALAALPERLGDPASTLADVIATSDRHGLALGPVLDQLTIETRTARRRLDQADARKLPVRLSFPLVTCTLPSFVLLAIAPAVIAALSSLGGTAW